MMNRKSDRLVVALLWLAGTAYLVGYVLNLIDLFRLDSILTGEGAVRIAGIFVPVLGPVLGWFF